MHRASAQGALPADDAEIRALDVSVLKQLRHHPGRSYGGYRKPDPLRIGDYRRIDADDLPMAVQQRAAGHRADE